MRSPELPINDFTDNLETYGTILFLDPEIEGQWPGASEGRQVVDLQVITWAWIFTDCWQWQLC